MSIELTEFNPVDFLENDEEIAEYLTQALCDEDHGVCIVALGHVVKRKGGVTEIARKAGVGRTSLYKTLSGTVSPGWETVHKLLNAQGVGLRVAL